MQKFAQNFGDLHLHDLIMVMYWRKMFQLLNKTRADKMLGVMHWSSDLDLQLLKAVVLGRSARQFA